MTSQRSIGLPLRIILLMAFSLGLQAQYMQDGSSTYSDMWFGDTTVYVTGSTAGALQIHWYRVGLTLRLPSGGVFSSTPSYTSGYVTNTLSADWTAADLDADFLGVSTHDLFCTASHVSAVLALVQFRKRPSAPSYQCTAGVTNICSVDSNSFPPLGAMKSVSCKRWNYCCDQSNQFYTGWCRREVCYKVAGQSYDPVASACMNEITCKDYRFSSYCLTQ